MENKRRTNYKFHSIPILVYGVKGEYYCQIPDNWDEYKPAKYDDINFEDLPFHVHCPMTSEGDFTFERKKEAMEAAKDFKSSFKLKAKIWTWEAMEKVINKPNRKINNMEKSFKEIAESVYEKRKAQELESGKWLMELFEKDFAPYLDRLMKAGITWELFATAPFCIRLEIGGNKDYKSVMLHTVSPIGPSPVQWWSNNIYQKEIIPTDEESVAIFIYETLLKP